MPDTSSDEQTTPETLGDAVGGVDRRSEGRLGIGLIVLWCSDEPDYLGAWLPIAAAEGGGARLLGRGPARADDEYPRLSILRQRPEENELLPAFSSEALSRAQLVIKPSSPEALEVVNVGRRKMLVNGASADQHDVRPGDIVEIGSRLTLLCAVRPSRFGAAAAVARHAFGRADDHGLVGESSLAWKLRSDVAFAARREGHVLILGPTGTGKELVAGALHTLSGRSGRLVSRNAATLPESLVDAELFGNPKGYPNPGVPEREGLIGAAHGGSLFLDEFAELPSGAQAHVLRVLDSGEYQRLGETQQRRSDFRLIAASNRPESALRPDLLARFDFRVRVPDLAARREDIPLLLRHLFDVVASDEPDLRERYALSNGLPRVAAGFIRRLMQEPYEANVRGLRQVLWSSLGGSTGDALEWPEHGQVSGLEGPADDLGPAEIQKVLDANNGSLDKTWRALGLANRYVLRRLIVRHGLVVTRRGRGP